MKAKQTANMYPWKPAAMLDAFVYEVPAAMFGLVIGCGALARLASAALIA